ncbi:MAG: DUF3017 domain-containing protein [Candidatus Nanopelagicales bacterium]
MSAASGDEYLVADSAAVLGAAEIPAVAIAPAQEPPAQWPFLLVAVVTLGGLALIGTGSLLQGLVGLVVAISLAALLRLVLPARTAGWLVSRSRWFDVGGFALLAGGLAGVTLLLMR